MFTKLTIGLIFILSNWVCFAKAGGESAGGGSDIKREFRQTANNLVTKLRSLNTRRAREIADSFQSTLKNSKFTIDIVEILVDPRTGNPVDNQRHLYGFSSRNHVQLKETPNNDQTAGSWERLIENKDDIDQDVCHEMMWAATGTDIDRDYQLCIDEFKFGSTSPPKKRKSVRDNSSPLADELYDCQWKLERAEVAYASWRKNTSNNSYISYLESRYRSRNTDEIAHLNLKVQLYDCNVNLRMIQENLDHLYKITNDFNSHVLPEIVRSWARAKE